MHLNTIFVFPTYFRPFHILPSRFVPADPAPPHARGQALPPSASQEGDDLHAPRRRRRLPLLLGVPQSAGRRRRRLSPEVPPSEGSAVPPPPPPPPSRRRPAGLPAGGPLQPAPPEPRPPHAAAVRQHPPSQPHHRGAQQDTGPLHAEV